MLLLLVQPKPWQVELHLLVHHFRDDTGGAVLDEPLGEVSHSK